ncbi:hypothetical protein DFH11DRAFT_182428 [Phellopilus nigrolimitatus]|nr:hypothetical protein DFH11DRAFT_182428 [Phellopilus nigrolimitatus]
MSSVAVRRFFAQTSRAGWRTSATTSVRRMGARRGMASDARVSGETSSNDTAWLIGSGTVTVLGADSYHKNNHKSCYTGRLYSFAARKKARARCRQVLGCTYRGRSTSAGEAGGC